MQIGTTGFNIASLLPSLTSSGSAQSSGQSGSSIFGPASLLSLGQGTGNQSAGTYTNLGGVSVYGGRGTNTSLGGFGVYSPGSRVTSFNLSSVMGQQTTGIPQQARSEEQQKAEAKAIEQALALVEAGQYEDARSVANAVLEDNKTSAAAVHVLGFSYQSEGNYEKAEQQYLRAHALDRYTGYDQDAQNARILQGSDEEVLRRGKTMVASPQQREEGIRILIALSQRNPEMTDANLALGDAMLAENDPLNGLMQYNTAIRSADSAQLGQIHDKLSELADEMPESAYVQQLMGKVEVKQGRFEQAIQTLKQSASLYEQQEQPGAAVNSDLVDAYIGFGRQKLDHYDISGAVATFKLAEELKPTDRDVKNALAEGYVARAEQHALRRDYSSAMEDYGRVADLVDVDSKETEDLRVRAAKSVYSVGRSLENRRIADGGEIDGEVLAYQSAHDLDPDSNKYRDKLAETRSALGDQYMSEGEYKKAASAYEKAYELDEHNDAYKDAAVNAHVAYADDRLYNLNYTDAIEAYRRAWEIDTDDMDIKAKLADAYFQRGVDNLDWEKWEDAAKDFQEALRLFPDNAEYQAKYDAYSSWLEN